MDKIHELLKDIPSKQKKKEKLAKKILKIIGDKCRVCPNILQECYKNLLVEKLCEEKKSCFSDIDSDSCCDSDDCDDSDDNVYDLIDDIVKEVKTSKKRSGGGVYEKTHGATATVNALFEGAGIGIGSGFFISKDGLFVTKYPIVFEDRNK